MAYSAFTLRQMTQQFSLELDEKSDLFAAVPEATLRPEFVAQLNELAPLPATLTPVRGKKSVTLRRPDCQTS